MTETNGTLQVDANRTYIEWAIQNGFAVIDMNIPRERLPDGASEAQVQEAANRHRNRAREAICFVYDNYLDEHSTDNIILMGSGEAFAVVKELLVNRSKFKKPFKKRSKKRSNMPTKSLSKTMFTAVGCLEEMLTRYGERGTFRKLFGLPPNAAILKMPSGAHGPFSPPKIVSSRVFLCFSQVTTPL